MKRIPNFVMLSIVAAFFVGCNGGGGGKSESPKTPSVTAVPMPDQPAKPAGPAPAFSLATSEYPSWSTFMVAEKAGLINGKKGKLGPLEEKYNVDIVLEVKDYDPCLAMYGNGAADAVCMTNQDALNPSLGRPTTVIGPTSTSVGADKVIAVGYTTLADMKGVKTYGLDKSVSRYSHYREIKSAGLNPADYPFENLDPAAAATALQSGTGDIKSICVWNPFALQTLRTNPNSKTIVDSSSIPEEIIDCICIGNDSLKKEGGERFATCVCDVYYQVCNMLNNSDKTVADRALTALGEDFSKLPLDDMRIVVKETRFYDSPEKGIALFSSDKFKETMKTVVTTCQEIEILEKGKTPPTIGYNDDTQQLNFSTKYMEAVSSPKVAGK